MKHRLLFRVSVPIIVIFTLGAVQSGEHSFTVFSEDGVMVSETTGGPRYQGELFSFEPVATVNQDPDNEESLLQWIGDTTLDADGNVYIADNRTCRIAVYNAEGEYSHSIGRQGNGPGEFQSIKIIRFEGEVLTLWDNNASRMSRFTRDGTFLESASPPDNARATGMLLLPDERILTWRLPFTPRDGYAWNSVVVSVFSVDGDTLATIRSEEVITGAAQTRPSPVGGTESIVTTIPLISRPRALFDPARGIMVATGMSSELLWYSLDGDLKQIYRLPFEVPRITNQIKRAWYDEMREMMRDFAERTGRDPGEVRDQEFTEYAALWSGGFIDDAGYIWLYAVHLPGLDEKPDGRSCHVLDPEGRYLGRSTLAGLTPVVRHGHMVSTAMVNDAGEQITTVYRMRPIPGNLDYPGSGR